MGPNSCPVALHLTFNKGNLEGSCTREGEQYYLPSWPSSALAICSNPSGFPVTLTSPPPAFLRKNKVPPDLELRPSLVRMSQRRGERDAFAQCAAWCSFPQKERIEEARDGLSPEGKRVFVCPVSLCCLLHFYKGTSGFLRSHLISCICTCIYKHS